MRGKTSASAPEPAEKKLKTETEAAVVQAADAVQEMPAQDEPHESSSEEWNLNDPADCQAFIESHFPASEVSSFGISIDSFSKVAAFYVDFLRFTRTPKAALAVHFQKEMIGPKTLGTKASRRKWLECWVAERKRVYVPKKK